MRRTLDGLVMKITISNSNEAHADITVQTSRHTVLCSLQNNFSTYFFKVWSHHTFSLLLVIISKLIYKYN